MDIEKEKRAIEVLKAFEPEDELYYLCYSGGKDSDVIRILAQLADVKHGYWEEVIGYGGWGDTHFRCSVCGEEWHLEDGKPKGNMNFCPRCGARMDGEYEWKLLNKANQKKKSKLF